MGSTLKESKSNGETDHPNANSMREYPNPVSSTKLSQRDQRALIFHLLYAFEACDDLVSIEAIAENISREYGFVILPQDQVFLTVVNICAERERLDQEIQPLLANWRFERLSVSTRIITRYALWELLKTETPASIVINEAVELAKCFAEDNAYRFVNGVLDEWAHKNGREDLDTDSAT